MLCRLVNDEMAIFCDRRGCRSRVTVGSFDAWVKEESASNYGAETVRREGWTVIPVMEAVHVCPRCSEQSVAQCFRDR